MSRLRAIVPAIVLCVCAAGVVVAARTLPSLRSLVMGTERSAGGEATLEEIRRIGELETLTYVQRTVFPHDFLDPETSMEQLVRRIAARDLPPAEALNGSDLRHFRAANLAADLGLAVSRDADGYVVVTTVLRFGYRLEEMVNLIEAGADDAQGSVTIPPAVLLATTTEDVVPERYPFGPIPLDADGWRRVAEFVERTTAETAPLDALIADASAGGRDLFAYLLGRQVRVGGMPELAPSDEPPIGPPR